jgi:polyhydroxyalkanoate synthesis regulator phasin
MMDDVLPLLARFHREVLLPDFQRVVTEAVGGLEERVDARFRDVFGHFDALHQRIDRLETEYQMIVAALRRLEDAASTQAAGKDTLRADLAALRARVDTLQEQVRVLEARLER